MTLNDEDYQWFRKQGRLLFDQGLAAARAKNFMVLADMSGGILGLSTVLDQAMTGKGLPEARRIDGLREELNGMFSELTKAYVEAGGTIY